MKRGSFFSLKLRTGDEVGQEFKQKVMSVISTAFDLPKTRLEMARIVNEGSA